MGLRLWGFSHSLLLNLSSNGAFAWIEYSDLWYMNPAWLKYSNSEMSKNYSCQFSTACTYQTFKCTVAYPRDYVQK